MTVLTRTGYLIDSGPIQEIKKELTGKTHREWRFWISSTAFQSFQTS